MCRMAGVVFRRSFPSDILSDLKLAAESGRVPDSEVQGHPDGWGIVSFSASSPFYIARRPVPIFQDPEFAAAGKKLIGLMGPGIVIAHARHSSKGKKSVENTHPFIVGQIALAHNGTVEGLTEPTSMKPLGGTDSELLALHLAEFYEDKNDLKSAMRSLVRETIRGKKFTAAIILASDGKELAGYRDYTVNEEYYNLDVVRFEDNVIIFQDSRSPYSSGSERIGKGELVIVDMDLRVTREKV